LEHAPSNSDINHFAYKTFRFQEIPANAEKQRKRFSRERVLIESAEAKERQKEMKKMEEESKGDEGGRCPVAFSTIISRNLRRVGESRAEKRPDFPRCTVTVISKLVARGEPSPHIE